jgi:fused signal recognition particle receptor
MAIGFIKKVFSFGKKEVEERIDESAPLAPINWAALEALRSTGEQIPETAQVPPEPTVPEQPTPEPVGPPAEVPPPAPTPVEVPPPVEPTATPVEVPTPPAEPVREPQPAAPREIPAEPKPAAPEPVPVEEPAKPPIEIPAEPEPQEAPAFPSPLREPEGRARSVARPRSIGEADRGGVAQSSSTAAPTLSGPSDWGEEPRVPAPALGKVTVTKKVAPKAEPVAPAAPLPRTTWFQRLREGLARSSRELSGNIAGVFTKRKLDEETLQDLEDVLIRADLGMETALRVTDALSASRYGKDVSDADVRAIMAVEIEKVLRPVALPLELDLSHKPHVILVVGVNGTGKTTTIGKLAAKLTEGGLSVMLAAGDTFRAAAIEQLKIWGERTRSPVIASKIGADAAGLAWDAFEKAKEAGSDVLIIDTAGRLQNRTELMAELEKIVRVLGKHDPEAPHTVLQTVDATTGQNALNQVEIFRNVAGVSGLVMTKLDGTARGGILVAIAAKHKLPVYFIGVGEQVDDLEPFSASDFAKAIAGVA